VLHIAKHIEISQALLNWKYCRKAAQSYFGCCCALLHNGSTAGIQSGQNNTHHGTCPVTNHKFPSTTLDIAFYSRVADYHYSSLDKQMLNYTLPLYQQIEKLM